MAGGEFSHDRPEKPVPGAESADTHINRLSADANLADPQSFTEVGGNRVKFDPEQFIKNNYGTEENFLKQQPIELRHQLGLPEGASSEQVFKRIADDTVNAFPESSPQMQDEILKSLGLRREQLSSAAVMNALVTRETRESGLAGKPSYEELERSMHERGLQQLKTGELPIDFN